MSTETQKVDTTKLRLIAKSNSDTAKTNALLNAAKEIDVLRAALARIGGAA